MDAKRRKQNLEVESESLKKTQKEINKTEAQLMICKEKKSQEVHLFPVLTYK